MTVFLLLIPILIVRFELSKLMHCWKSETLDPVDLNASRHGTGLLSLLKHIAASRKTRGGCRQWHLCEISNDEHKNSEQFIIRIIQQESFQREIEALRDGNPLPRDSSIKSLDPYLDSDGLMQVGGRLRNSDLGLQEKNPVVIPKKSHVAHLLVAHYHQEVKHQGRLFTEGAIRKAGYWIIGCRRMINSYLQKCVRCLKLRGIQRYPKMADLPSERLCPAPPFTHIGVDVFGPWTVVTRRTRGGQAKSKRWAVLFTCLVTRAVHIEVVEEMTTSSFINSPSLHSP